VALSFSDEKAVTALCHKYHMHKCTQL